MFHKGKIKVSVSWALIERLWEKPASKFIQVVYRIQFLAIVDRGPLFLS
jgi:hypothetical protein